MNWNYISDRAKSNGYEEYMDELKSYNKKHYLSLSEEEKHNIENRIFEIYRGKNIFPITYYNHEGIITEIQNCINKEVEITNDCCNLSYNQGSSLCRFLFPNLFTVECKGQVGNTPIDKFYNDEKLKRAILFCLNYKNSSCPVTPSGIKDGIDMIGGNVATNFKPMTAKAIYEMYCEPNGIIYDYACGFGGRLLGALSSKNNYKYIGVEPCIETYNNLNLLGLYIEEVTHRTNSFKIINDVSQNFTTYNSNVIDFAFSSPPYFNLEKYSDEQTQCYNEYNEIEEWNKNYVLPTIQNIYYMLKPNHYYAVNIADFKLNNRIIHFVDKWIELSQDIGFTFIKCMPMKLQTRRGNGHDETNLKTKEEGIYIFKK